MQQFDEQLYGDGQFRSRPKNIYFAYARAVNEILSPKNVLDLGCANGYSLEWWHRQGIKILGVERAAAAFKFMPPAVKKRAKQLDLRQPLRLGQFDLINCTEVGEHLERKYAPVLIKSIAAAAKNWVVLSWSNETGSPEHLNPRPPEYIRSLAGRHGLYYEPELTWQLKTKLAEPTFDRWRHWHRNVQIFSRTPPGKRVLIRHFEWHPSYHNKNVGYFVQTARTLGFGPRWTPNDWAGLFKHWRRVWLYPFEKHLLVKLFILKLWGNRTILKLDSVILSSWRAWLAEKLVWRVIAETEKSARPFDRSSKLVYFSGGLPRKNIDLIRSLKVTRKKIILYAGRPVFQKGFDRLKKIIPPGWQLRLATDLPPEKYYRLVKLSSLIVLPTRGEGWPNVFQDAFYCRRLFLTTTGATCGKAILDKTFYCANNSNALRRSIKKITGSIDRYYRRYGRLYEKKFFQVTDPVFTRLLEETN